MAGTITLSMTQQMDQYGDPLSGGLLYFFVAGTVATPQNAYKDLALTLPHPNPITLDAAGRIPQLYFADGVVKIRLTDRTGVVVLSADDCQVIGSSSGGGGGGGSSVALSEKFQTGDLKPRYDTGVHDGWVPCNARTIGATGSGASELADTATAHALFIHLWTKNPNLVLIPARGTVAETDWGLNKQLTLPDLRGVGLIGLADMGNTASTRLNATYFGTSPIVLGALGGGQAFTQTTTTMPSHSHSVFMNDPGHIHNFTQDGSGVGTISVAKISNQGAAGGDNRLTTSSNVSINSATVGLRAWDGSVITDTTFAAGSSAPHTLVQPSVTVSIYIKLAIPFILAFPLVGALCEKLGA